MIDRNIIVRHAVGNDSPLTHNNVDEMIRMVDVLIFFEENGGICPADKSKGDQ